MNNHSVPLGDGRWRVWRAMIVRSAGFPLDSVLRAHDPQTATEVDALVAAGRREQALALAEDAYRRQRELLVELTTDPDFRAAIAWQSPTVAHALAHVAATSIKPSKQRQADRVVARYWQRYTTKNETIGFFGPGSWGEVSDQPLGLRVEPGPDVVAELCPMLEDWAVDRLGVAVARDPLVAPHVPAWRPSHLVVEQGRAVPASGQAVPLQTAEAWLLEHADGRARSALVADAVAAGVARRDVDAGLALDRLVQRELLLVGFDVWPHPAALDSLLAQIEELPADAAARGREMVAPVLGALQDLRGRERDPDAATTGLRGLAEAFAAVTGEAAQRRAGETYAARSVAYLEGRRDVGVTIGSDVLAGLAAPLSLLLDAATWVCDQMASTYLRVLDEVVGDLGGDEPDVPLSEVAYVALGTLFGPGERPAHEVEREFMARWRQALPMGDDDVEEVTFSSGEVRARFAELFPPPSPSGAWPAARLHSPDLHLAAGHPDDVTAGRWYAVLGELHAGWPSFDQGAMTASCPDVEALRAAMHADLGPDRIRLLHADGWQRLTGRLTPVLMSRGDSRLAMDGASTRGLSMPGFLRAVDCRVLRIDGELRMVHGERSWPLLAAFSDLLAIQTVDAFKLTSRAERTPRVRLDRLVIQRRGVRTTCGESGLADLVDDRERYLAVRALAARLGLGDAVFVGLGTETKPFYTDLSSPVHASVLATMVRSAVLADGPDVRLSFSEMLPRPDEYPLLDARGRHYVNEFRWHCVLPKEAL